MPEVQSKAEMFRPHEDNDGAQAARWSFIQTFGWVTTTATAVYSVRTRRIQQHKEWMMRSYPFAMGFIVHRVITFFLVRMRSGELAFVVWCGACWRRRVSCRRL